jgi:hypothetical protein
MSAAGIVIGNNYTLKVLKITLKCLGSSSVPSSLLMLPGAPNVLSGRLAGLLETVAMRHDTLDFSCVVSLFQSHMSLSNRHSPTRTYAPEGMAAMIIMVVITTAKIAVTVVLDTCNITKWFHINVILYHNLIFTEFGIHLLPTKCRKYDNS